MKNIKINKTEIHVTSAEVRVLQTLVLHNFKAPADAFQEGSGNFRTYILPTGARAALLGINKKSSANKKREREYFKRFPRRRVCVTGDPKRINAILKKINISTLSSVGREITKRFNLITS